MTPFEAALHNFERYAWGVNPALGAGVSEIILREYVPGAGGGFGGFGDGDPFNLDTSVSPFPIADTGTGLDSGLPGISQADVNAGNPFLLPNASEGNVLDSLGKFIDQASGTILKTAQTYFTTKQQLANLRTQAQQPVAPVSRPLSPSLLLMGGAALVAVMLVASTGGGRRR